MDRLDALAIFVAVAEHRSFSEAGRVRHVSPAVASRAVAALEAELGVTLFRRTTRSVALTPEGTMFLERARRALGELDEGRRAVLGERSEPQGSLVVNAPVVFGRLHILPVVSRLLRDYPRLAVRLSLTDRMVRVVEEGIDIAVRVAPLADTALHAVRIAEVRRVLVASPAYLAARGEPSEPADLHGHDLIAFDGFAVGSEWRFGPEGRPSLRFDPRLLTDSVEAAVDAAIDGVGIARPLNYQVAAAIAAGRLVYLLPAYEPPPLPISLVFQGNRRASPNVRAFVEAAQARFRLAPLGGSDAGTNPHPDQITRETPAPICR